MMTDNPFLSEAEGNTWKTYLNSKLSDKIKFIDRVNTHEKCIILWRRLTVASFHLEQKVGI